VRSSVFRADDVREDLGDALADVIVRARAHRSVHGASDSTCQRNRHRACHRQGFPQRGTVRRSRDRRSQCASSTSDERKRVAA
jgi:hypothetical protein